MLVETDDSASRRRSRPSGVLGSPLRRFWGDARPTPPWDDSAPIRAELFSVERLEEHARSLVTAALRAWKPKPLNPLELQLAAAEVTLRRRRRLDEGAHVISFRPICFGTRKRGARKGPD